MTSELERVDWVPGQIGLPGMPEEGVLFLVDRPEERVSADRRRTLRQRADVEAGRHPLTRGPARPDLGTCGTCAHRVHVGGFPKCDLGPQARSASTDVRAWWPACDRWATR